MRMFLLVILFVCSFPGFSFSYTVQEKMAMAEEYAAKGDLSRAVYTYEMVGLDGRNTDDLRARAWYEAAVIVEERLKDYNKTFRILKRIEEEYPEFAGKADFKARLKKVEGILSRYGEPIRVIEEIRYTDVVDIKVIKGEIRVLKKTIRDYPDFFNIAQLYALLGNRYFKLSKWFKAYVVSGKALKLNPDLYGASPLGRDFEISRDTFYRRFLTGVSWVFLVLYMGLLIYLKPWKHIGGKQVKRLLVIAGIWVIFVGIFYHVPLLNTIEKSFPLLKGIETPNGLSTPIYIVLWYRPLMSLRFWMFVVYSVIAIVLTWLGIQGMKAREGGIVQALVIPLAVTLSLMTLYFYHHGDKGFRYRNFMFWEENSDIANKTYPNIFKEVTALEAGEE